jgi:hypothetical protein
MDEWEIDQLLLEEEEEQQQNQETLRSEKTEGYHDDDDSDIYDNDDESLVDIGRMEEYVDEYSDRSGDVEKANVQEFDVRSDAGDTDGFAGPPEPSDVFQDEVQQTDNPSSDLFAEPVPHPTS